MASAVSKCAQSMKVRRDAIFEVTAAKCVEGLQDIK